MTNNDQRTTNDERRSATMFVVEKRWTATERQNKPATNERTTQQQTTQTNTTYGRQRTSQRTNNKVTRGKITYNRDLADYTTRHREKTRYCQ